MTMNHRLALKKLIENCGLTAYQNEPLSRHSTWRIGGPADLFVAPSSWQQVGLLLRHTHACNIPTIIIGKGSNLLFDDAGFRGIVIKISRKLARLSISGMSVRAESGIATPRLARAVGLAGLSGLEHIVGIPGTLGGLVVMNGGSQRKTIGEVIVEVKVMDLCGEVHTVGHDECELSYRHSKFQNADSVLTEVTMELSAGRRDEIITEMLQILRQRRRKFPLTMPNSGSVFKCTKELYETIGSPGAVIEKLGLKGLRVGEAAISERHANFIVNLGAARSADVLQLIHCIRDRVYRATGVWMQCEAQYVSVESSGHASQDTTSWPRRI